MTEISLVPPNLEILDDAFYIPQLDRTRRIWVYLPLEYGTTEKRFPVIYMQDGQNLFDTAFTSGTGWGIDETMLAMNGKCIIVGIDNGKEKRINEYNFRDHEEHGEGEGRKFISFIAETLKPFIDSKYRTLPDRLHTYLAGSSLGGLVSLYGTLYFADTFGGAGIFSPALWIIPDLAEEIENIALSNANNQQHFYFYGGGKEDENLISNIENIATMLSKYPQYKLFVDINPDGEHSEQYWKERFPAFFIWLNENAPAEILS
ncbi:MAG: alpha/beta hydrolase [Fimbriimonadaceae bacterium]|nr:alpha/beta hydrolase [Chitinophagales bacterium]